MNILEWIADGLMVLGIVLALRVSHLLRKETKRIKNESIRGEIQQNSEGKGQ